MNPLSIRLQNCRTWDDISFDLHEGIIALTGPNGAGKSTLVNAIEVALFGPEGRSLADWYPRAGGESSLQIELVFEHAAQSYRVRRSYSPKGRGQSRLDLEHAVPGYDETDLRAGIEKANRGEDPGLFYDHWEPLTLESQTETQALIETLIGISRDTFRASSFLAQGEAGYFCEAQPRQRKAILAQILGLQEWERWLEQARQEKRQVEGELDRIAGALERAEQELAERDGIQAADEQARIRACEIEEALAEAVAAAASARQQRAEADTRLAARRAASAAEEAAQRALDEFSRRLWSHEEEAQALTIRLADRTSLEQHAGRLPELLAEQEQLAVSRNAWQERQRLEQAGATAAGEAADIAKRYLALEQRARQALDGIGSETCELCGQVLHEEAARHAAVSYSEDAERLRQRLKALEEEVNAAAASASGLPAEAPDLERLAIVGDEIEAAHEARRRLAALDEATERRERVDCELLEMRAELPRREQAVAAARAELEALGPHDPDEAQRLDQAVGASEARERALSTHAQAQRAELARLDERLERLDRIAAESAEAMRERERLHDRLALAAAMERACGPNGVPALIMETVAIPQVEIEATRILGLLGGPAFAAELRTQRATKTGGVADALDIVLLTDSGDAPYETFSGGERARVAFALRLALAQLLAARRGSETGLLVIDEIDGLDQQGVAALVGVLEGLRASVPRIVVVSHQVELRDAFPNSLALENVDGRSRIVGSPEPEPEEALL